MTRTWFKNLLALLVISLIASCVGEKTGKDPKCDTGKAFDKLSQACVAFGRAPTSTLNVLNLQEDQAPTTFKLQYSDDNNDQAVMCEVFDSESDIEIRSPLFGSIFDDSQYIVNQLAKCVADVSPVADGLYSVVLGARDTILASDKTTSMSSAMSTFYNNARNLANYCQSVSGKPIANFYGNGAANNLTNYLIKKSWIDKRCYCMGGECSAEVVLSKDKFGQYGISYNISDSPDGTSVTKQVMVEVQSINDKPSAQDGYFSGNESVSSLPLSFVTPIPVGVDLESPGFSLSYSLVTAPTKGTLTNCALANDGTGPTVRNCIYTPLDKDLFSASMLNKFATLNLPSTTPGDELLLTAKAAGAVGETISIRAVSAPILGTGNNVDVEVDASTRAITVYIEDGETSITAISNAINGHYLASSIVQASVVGSGLSKFAIMGSSQSLSGGNEPFDFFTYKVHDGQDYSDNIGTISIDIIAQDDSPIGLDQVLALDFQEDFSKSIIVKVYDAEADPVTNCEVIPDANIYVTSIYTLGADSCSFEITPRRHFNGSASFEWRITTTDPLTPLLPKNTGWIREDFTVTPLNDAPFAKSVSLDLGAESATATAVPINLPTGLGLLSSDIDGDILTYEFLGLSGTGTFGGCLLGTQIITGATCTYTPVDGNVNGVANIFAAGLFDMGGGNTITFTSKNYGQNLNGLKISIEDSASAEYLGPFVLVSSSSVSDTTITVFVKEGVTTLNDIVDAIDDDIYASELISAVASTNALILGTPSLTTLAGGNDALDIILYSVTDPYGEKAYGSIHLNLTPTDDHPVVCPYSDFIDAPECGLAGCVGNTTPILNGITPKSVGALYYDKNSAVCYKSNGTSTANDWEVVTDFTNIIEKKIVNQNGFVEIDNIRIDEGGADSTEDIQEMKIVDVRVIDGGLGLIPRKAANIQVFYGGEKKDLAPPVPGVTDFMTGDIDDPGAISSDELPLKVKIIPSDGVSGTAVVTFTFSDGVNNVDLSIPIEITNVAIQHKGWSNIVAMGPKVDKNGNVKGAKYVCNYSETKCDGGESCLGNSSPLGSIDADEVNSIYYESPSTSKPDGQCYYASSTGKNNWIAFNSFCNMTASYYDGACSGNGATCLDDEKPTVSPENLNTFFTDLDYDAVNEIAVTTCYRSIGRSHDSIALTTTQIESSWQEYKGTGSVELKWNPMVLSGVGSISGYNVFRRLPLEDFDYNRPINKSLVAPFTYMFTDNSTNSNFGPVPNTVYFYEVVPVVSVGSPAQNVQIRTSDFEKIILRVLVPGENKVLVPRDIVNISQCTKLLDSSGIGSNYEYDASLKTFTCPYGGPGDSASPSLVDSIYDFGQDLIVDRFEAGCPYTKSNEPIESCPTGLSSVATSGSCIGTVDPTVADNGGPITFLTPDDQVYYNRSSGKCFQHDGTSWNELNALDPVAPLDIARIATLADRYSNAELPPIVHLSQDRSKLFCEQTVSKAILGICNTTSPGYSIDNPGSGKCLYDNGVDPAVFEYYGNVSGKLPSRKEQVAYSDWDSGKYSDPQVSIFEGGLSLNSNSKCNTSSASGLESSYTDSVTPISNTLFTLPGTLGSGIRSLMTGSEKTQLCSSRYGVQDSVGNVTEWSSDRFKCSTNGSGERNCVGVTTADGAEYIGDGADDFSPVNGTVPSLFSTYAFDGIVGPCSGISCVGSMTSWIYGQKSNQANRFFTPMGLPAVEEFNSASPSSDFKDFVWQFFERIGITSGITSTGLRSDTIIVNQALIDPDPSLNPANTSGLAGVVTGGGYTTSNGAGTYHLEMIPTDDPAYSTRVDVGFRCVFSVDQVHYIE